MTTTTSYQPVNLSVHAEDLPRDTLERSRDSALVEMAALEEQYPTQRSTWPQRARARFEGLEKFYKQAVDFVGEPLDNSQRRGLHDLFGLSGPITGDAASGVRPGRPLGRSKFADIDGFGGGGDGPGFGGWIRDVLTNRPTATRDQLEGTGSAGGYLVPQAFIAEVFDLARAKMVTADAGLTVIPLTEQVTKAAKVATDEVPTWRAEAASINTSAMTLGSVTFTPQSLGVLVKASLELIEDAPNVQDVLTNSIAQVFARELDRVVLYGSGASNQPQGIRTAAGVASTSMGTNGAALTNWDNHAALAMAAYAANYDNLAIVQAPRTEQKLAVLKDTTNQYLRIPAYLENIPRLTTSAVLTNETQGSSSLASTVFCGDFSRVALGMRTELKIIPLKERFMDTGEVAFVGWLRADVQIIRPDAFQILIGVL